MFSREIESKVFVLTASVFLTTSLFSYTTIASTEHITKSTAVLVKELMSEGKYLEARDLLSKPSSTKNTKKNKVSKPIKATESTKITAPTLDIVEKAKILISKKKYLQAYELLKKSERQNATNQKYNYQLGVAALRAGKYTDALYALDRVVSEDPNNIGAQLDMAIAYFYLGNLPFAKQELVRILKNYDKVAPQVVKRTIKAYIAKINKAQTPKTLSVVASVSTGYSDNINSGYDGNEVYIPLINANTILSDQSIATPAPFVNAQVIVNKTKKLNRNTDLATTAMINKKIYSGYSGLDQANAMVSASASRKINEHTLKLNQSATRSYLNSEPNYDILATTASITTQPNKSQSFGATLRSETMKFSNPSSQPNNSKKQSFSISASDTIMDKKVGVTFGFGVSRNRLDDSTASNGNSNSKNINLTFKKPILGTMGSVSLGYKQDSYDKENVAFGVTREDVAKSITFGVTKPLDAKKSLDFSIGYRNQDSSIELYKNDALTQSVGFKQSF